MPSLSLTIKQADEVLKEVLQLVEEEYEKPNSVLSETDRNEFVGEEQSLRKRLKESESNSSWRVQCLFSKKVPSPQAKCLEEAKDLRQRIKHDIRSKWGTRFTAGRSNALGLSNLMGTRALEADTPADGNSERVSTIVMSPLSIPVSGVSQPIVVDAAVRNDRDYSSDLNEAISTPFRTSIDAPTPRSPPPPPLRRMAQSILSEATGNQSTHSPGRSLSVRRLAPPPPPQSPSRNSYISSETTDISGTLSAGRSPSIRRPPPPPPQSPSRNSHILLETTDSTGTSSPSRSPSIRRLPPPPPPQSPSRNSHVFSETTDSTPCCTVTQSPIRRPAPPPPLSPSRNSRIFSEITDNPGTLSASMGGAAPSSPQSPARSSSRRPAPPPPLSPSCNSHILPESTDNPATQSPGRPPSIRRPAPPPPKSPLRSSYILPETTVNPGTVPLGRSSSVGRQPPQSPRRQSRGPVPITIPINLSSGTIPRSAQGSFDAATIASINQLVEQIIPLATSIAAKAQTATSGNRKGHGRHSSAYVSKTNCMDISDSNVEGITMNNGGFRNSGAVINKGVMPTTHSSRQVPIP